MKREWVTQFNIIGEFRNKELEKAYRVQYIEASRKLIGTISAMIGCVYLALLAFDAYMMRHIFNISVNAAMRGGVFLLSIGMFVLSKKVKSPNILLYTLLGFVCVTIVNYQLILYLHREPNFMDQAMVFLLMVFAIFMVPNRFVNNLLLGIGITAMFFILAPTYTHSVQPYQYYNALVYFAIAIVIGSAHSYNVHIYSRMQYVRGAHRQDILEADGLANIYTRPKFDHIFRRWVHRAKMGGAPFSVVMFDLDGFKRLNNMMGHAMGDKILVECITEVSNRLRAGDIFARWGGEEFMILLPERKISEARLIADRLRRQIEMSFKRHNVPITASFGVTQYKENDTPDTIIHRVDVNMYAAKDSGKNSVHGD